MIKASEIFNDQIWAAVLRELGPAAAAAELRDLIADIGRQEQVRGSALGELRENPEVDDDEYAEAKAEFHAWRQGAAHVKHRARRRLEPIQEEAQNLIEAHQLDRRSLMVLAKRIWLWQQGREHDLETALDFKISMSNGHGPVPLRELIEDIASKGEVRA